MNVKFLFIRKVCIHQVRPMFNEINFQTMQLLSKKTNHTLVRNQNSISSPIPFTPWCLIKVILLRIPLSMILFNVVRGNNLSPWMILLRSLQTAYPLEKHISYRTAASFPWFLLYLRSSMTKTYPEQCCIITKSYKIQVTDQTSVGSH